MVSVDGGGGGNPKQLAAAAVELEETELRLGLGLGLPGGSSDKKQEDHNIINANGKRNFAQTMDLKLNLASAAESLAGGSTRDSTSEKNLKKEKELLSTSNESLLKPPAKYAFYHLFLIHKLIPCIYMHACACNLSFNTLSLQHFCIFIIYNLHFRYYILYKNIKFE